MGINFQWIYRMTKEVLASGQHLFDLYGERKMFLLNILAIMGYNFQ